MNSLRLARWLAAAALFAGVAVLAVTGTALAHGQTEAAGYVIEIGFLSEPAYVGEPNAMELLVTDKATGKPVDGLEKTLQAEVIFGSARKSLTLAPEDEKAGAYSAAIIPTRAGDYTFHVWGQIEGKSADVSMTSAPDTFSSAISKDDDSFPPPDSQAAGQSVQPALLVAIVGLIVGLAALIAAVIALRAARKPA